MTMPFSYQVFPAQSLEYYKDKRAKFLARKVECPHDKSAGCLVCVKAKNAFLAELDNEIRSRVS